MEKTDIGGKLNMKFFAVYDLQTEGFRAGMTGTDPKNMIDMMVDYICNIITEDEECEYEDASDIEIIDTFGFTFCEVSEKDAEIIENSEDCGLLTTGKGVNVAKYKSKILPIEEGANAYRL